MTNSPESSSDLERAARALCDVQCAAGRMCCRTTWLGDGVKAESVSLPQVCDDAVRAILTAIREPSEAVLIAGAWEVVDAPETFKKAWQAAIDSILEGK